MLLPDHIIRALAENVNLITPFEPTLIREIGESKIASFGLSGFGYDVRLSTKFLVPRVPPKRGSLRVISDIKDPNPLAAWQEVDDQMIVILANSMVIGHSIETFTMPRTVLGMAFGKSTYARIGVTVVNTPILEPGWQGQLTLSIANNSPFDAKVYAGEGIAQVVFMEGKGTPRIAYDQRNGKYQASAGIAEPKV